MYVCIVCVCVCAYYVCVCVCVWVSMRGLALLVHRVVWFKDMLTIVANLAGIHEPFSVILAPGLLARTHSSCLLDPGISFVWS
jgi:hypothetical protein